VNFALGVMAFAHAPLLGVFMAAILTRRGNTASVIAALVAGALAVLMLQPYMVQSWLDFKLAWPWWSVIVSPLSFVICILGKGSVVVHHD
jgi:SSS family solute:Na+ symporter